MNWTKALVVSLLTFSLFSCCSSQEKLRDHLVYRQPPNPLMANVNVTANTVVIKGFTCNVGLNDNKTGCASGDPGTHKFGTATHGLLVIRSGKKWEIIELTDNELKTLNGTSNGSPFDLELMCEKTFPTKGKFSAVLILWVDDAGTDKIPMNYHIWTQE